MYYTWALISATQGRLHLTDHIIENNPVMPHVLPTLGFKHVAELRSKVRRHHSMNLWCYNLLEQGIIPIRERIKEIGNDIEFNENVKDTFFNKESIMNCAKNISKLTKIHSNLTSLDGENLPKVHDLIAINDHPLNHNRGLAKIELGWWEPTEEEYALYNIE
jgi:hypothetical protein